MRCLNHITLLFMKKRLLLVFFILLQSFIKVYSQTGNNLSSFVPMVSQTASTINNYNADYYTGRLNYNSPLTNVSMYGIDMPISLNYLTNGMKVQDVSGITGLGWTLSLGGTITRELHGLPDDQYNGYCRVGEKNQGLLNQEYIKNVSDGTWDSEPDKFSFSFLGFTGTFVLDPYGNPLLQSNQAGVKIDYCPFTRSQLPLGANNKWILRDQKGNQYFFEMSQVTSGIQHGAVKNTFPVYVSSWFITKIITASNQQIDFSYTNGAPVNYSNYLNVRRIDKLLNGNTTLFSCLGKKHTADTTYNENIDINYQNTYLTKISGNGVDINLGYNLTRLDLTNSKALTDISVNYNNKVINNYKLNYNYFTSDDGTNTKRLKLSSISQVYAGNNLKTLYSFYYNETVNLPARNSFKSDYMGYYNANSQNSNLNGFADKTPNLTNTQANILQKVTNILGGSVNFEYELNKYKDGSGEKTGAGLRVSRIYEKKNDAESSITNQLSYSYTLAGSTGTSGQVYSFYSPYWTGSFYVFCNNNSGAIYYYTSEMQETLADGNGANVGYSQVAVSKTDGSIVRYTMTNYSDYPDKNVVYNTYSNSAITFNNNDQSNLSSYNDKPRSSFLFARGKILKEESIDAAGQVVKTITYNYSLTVPSGLVVGIRPSVSTVNGGTFYDVTGFSYQTQDLRLDSKTEQMAKANVNQQLLTENYTYTTTAPNLIRSVASTLSSGKSEKTTFRYAFDLVPAQPTSQPGLSMPFTWMIYNNIIADPVEIVRSVTRNGQTKIIAASVTKYKSFNNTVLPSTEVKLESKYPIPENEYVIYQVAYNNGNEVETIDSRLKPFRLFNKYNSNNTLLEQQSYTTPAKYASTLVGYNGMYKTAEIDNASLVDIAYTSFESNDKGNWTYSGIPIFDLSSATGNKYYDLSKGNLVKNDLTAGTTYIITYWTRNTTFYTISGTQGTPLLLANRNGWNCYQHTISNQTNISISGGGAIDEVRLYPMGAKIVTGTYEPLVGMTSKNDENNQIVYYEYDEYNRLQYVRDNEKNIIKAYCYNVNGEPGNCFITTTNQLQSRAFNKDNCGAGVQGSSVIYQVPPGRYSAATQEAANALAQIEIDQNGQNYANINGTCTSVILYARIEMSNVTNDSWSSPNGEGGSSSLADISINFYSDADGRTPFVLNRPITVVVAQGSSWNTAYNGSGSSTDNVSYTVAAGQSSFSLGRRTLSSYGSYIDPYSGSGLIYESHDYTYNVVSSDGSYIPF